MTRPTEPTRHRKDGIRDLAALKGRCRIDDDTGCWVWSGAMRSGRHPSIWGWDYASGAMRNMTAPKLALTLRDDKALPVGTRAYRLCCNNHCCNPGHMRKGTPADIGAHRRAMGLERGHPERRAVNMRNVSSRVIPRDLVQRIEAKFAAGAVQQDVVAEFGVAPKTAARIRDGLHPNCSARQGRRLVAAASVFAWGAAA